MCWVNRKLEILTAETDLVVYKYLHKVPKKWYNFWKSSVFKSPFTGFEYKPYKKNEEIKLVAYEHSLSFEIDEGYHSYANDFYDNYFLKNKGYIKYKCIIPKGSKYAINDLDEVVSSNIIITNHKAI